MSKKELNRLRNKFSVNKIIIDFFFHNLLALKLKQRELSLHHYLHTGKFLD